MLRVELLKKILNMEKPLKKLIKELESFGWDTDKELILLKRQHILNILQEYTSGKLEKSEIENWANIIECREDIGREEAFKALINEVIHELANPNLTVILSKKRASILCNKLTI
jgi:hypothetical protein